MVWLLIVLQFFLALGALGGGGALLAAPDGSWLKMPMSMLKYSPFPDFLIPAAILFIFLGIYPVAVAYSLWKRPNWRWPDFLNPFKGMHWSWAGSLAAGMMLIIWITVEVLMLRSIAFLHVLYFGLGVAIVVMTLVPKVRRHFAATGIKT